MAKQRAKRPEFWFIALLERKSSLGILKRVAWGIALRAGYDKTNWLRVVQNKSIQAKFDSRQPGDILEVSPGWNRRWRDVQAKSYTAMEFPEYSIDRDVYPGLFDTVIADQVLEHVVKPVAAVANIKRMLKPGGVAIVATPFLFRVHGRPYDFTRWTQDGLRQLMLDGGFAAEKIEINSWGNQKCARAHIGGPVRDYGWWRDLSNDPEYPILVWAFAEN